MLNPAPLGTSPLSAVLLLVAGTILGFLARRYLALKKLGTAEERTKAKLEEAEAKSKSITLEAEKKAADLLARLRNEEAERKKQTDALEARLVRKEEILEQKSSALDVEISKFKTKEERLEEKAVGLEKKLEEAEAVLEKTSGITREEAKSELLAEIRRARADDLAAVIQKIEKENREEAEKRAAEIVATALQRYARSHVSEATTTAYRLADEELKGKIIGREGRNIRALERATGVEFVMDETPDSVVISSFDPYRREIARMALDKLIKDGRIQPAKIEEKTEEARAELERRTQEIGEAAAAEIGVFDLPKEILRLLGRLHFRTSYGQNVLTHSLEMAHLAGMMAAELGLDVDISKRGALLHDIGKAIDHEVEGTHVDLGVQLLKKYGINERVIQAMQSHHEDYPYASSEAYVVTAADVLSAARPGARRGTLEAYVKRLGDLERIAGEFPGVKQAYAISAGRELRVFVIPEKIDDFGALELARKIADRIQAELKYPGEIKVNVIREIRAVEYAR